MNLVGEHGAYSNMPEHSTTLKEAIREASAIIAQLDNRIGKVAAISDLQPLEEELSHLQDLASELAETISNNTFFKYLRR